MAGSTQTHTEGSKLAGMSIQTSLLGQPIPMGWGRARLSCNLIDYLAFKAIPHTTKTKTGGKGGSSSTSDTTYTYSASIELGICEGPITGIVTVYKDSATLVGIGAAGLNIALGTTTQTPWAYLTSLFPDHALAYRTLAYAYAQDYDLGDTATVANHGFEIDFLIQLGGGVVDADPKDVLTDFFTSDSHGVPGFTSALLGDWSDYSLYARASNLLLSPVIDQTVQASDFVTQVMAETNSDCFWSEGVLKIKPFGDAAVTGNGVTWTPDLTPQYDLTEDDFLDEVTLEIVDQSDAYNHVTIEYLDRTNQYNTANTSAYDLDNVVTLGLRKQDPQQFHDICDPQIARTAAQLWLQRTLFIRDNYHFDLPMDFIGLEPMDYATLTTSVDGMVLDRQLVMIDQIDEDEDGADVLHVTAEGIPGHTASAALYAAHVASGFVPDLEADPGNVATPILFNAPVSLAPNGYEAWAAVCGTTDVWGGANIWVSFDGTNYNMVGKIAAPARYGVLTATLASHADPDTTDTLSVDMTASKAALGTVTTAEADNGASLCLIGSELVSYANAALTSAYHYDLTYLRRAQRGSAAASHSSGANFIRLDDALFRIAYLPENSGATMSVKFQSFNYFGRGLQDLASLSPYTLTLTPAGSLPALPTGLALASGGSTWTGNSLDLICNPADRATSYRFDIYKSDGTTLVRSITNSSPSASYTATMAALDGALREYKIKVTGINDAGAGPSTTQIDVTNAAPAALSGVSASGGTDTGSVTATASTDTDAPRYIVFFSSTTGFNPATTGGVVQSGTLPVYIYGQPAGTYYCRIAAFDPWTADPGQLNLSTETNFVISAGGGSTPSGGGDTGGGYTGNCVTQETPILMAKWSWLRFRWLPGHEKPMRNCQIRERVWTRHEVTMQWGAFPIVALSWHDALAYRAHGYPRAAAHHRFWNEKAHGWIEMRMLGEPDAMAVVGKMTVGASWWQRLWAWIRGRKAEGAHTYVAAGILSHNWKPDLP